MGLSLTVAVICPHVPEGILTVYADQPVPVLSDRKFNEALSEMVVDYGKENISRAAAVRNPYVNERLILVSTDGAVDPDDYGAVDAIHSRRGMYVLQFDSVKDTRRAETMLENESSTVYVVPDQCVFLQEEAYESLSVYDEIYEKMAEGPRAIGADVLGAELKNVNGSVTAAILDTGIAFRTSELQGRLDVTHAYSFINECDVNVCNDSPENCRSSASGHGTHVAGILAKSTEQVADKVKILPIRVLDNDGSGFMSTVVSGIYYAADHGAKVINMSLGGGAGTTPAMVDAINYAIGKGAVVVTAAGNESDNTAYHEPSNNDACVVVGAVDKYNDRAYFSNYGDTLDIMAPGVSVLSCTYYWALHNGSWVQVAYAAQSGTSMATPYAAGAAALLRLKYPSASPGEIEKLLQLSTQDLGVPGKDVYYGYGAIDLALLAGAQHNQVSAAHSHIQTRKDNAAAEKAAKQVVSLIDALPGTVKLQDKTAVENARKRYNALTALQKTYVTNLSRLVSAEQQILALEAAQRAAAEKAAAEKKRAEEEAAAAAKKKQAEEAAAKKKQAEEAAAKKKQAEEAAAAAKKKQAEEAAAAAKKKQAEEAAAAAKKKQAEEAAEAAKKKQAEEAAEAAKKKQAEEAAEAAKKKQAEEAAAAEKKRAEEEAAAAEKRRAEEEAAAQERRAEEEAAAQQEALRMAQEASFPRPNADYVIPIRQNTQTDALRVLGLGPNDYILSWASSDPSVVTVDGRPDGTCIVTARDKTAEAFIYAGTASGTQVAFHVHVQKKKVSIKGVSIPSKKETLSPGQRLELQALPKPVTADGKLTFSSSKKSVASVSPQGVVTAKKPGTAVITIRCGRKKVKVKIKVRRG